jgi:hypothetical protein
MLNKFGLLYSFLSRTSFPLGYYEYVLSLTDTGFLLKHNLYLALYLLRGNVGLHR